MKSQFFTRQEVQMPGQGIYTSKPPMCYKPQHMFVGATLVINSYNFILINADEYCLRYMELNYPEVHVYIFLAHHNCIFLILFYCYPFTILKF